jgi:hypothetical protein
LQFSDGGPLLHPTILEYLQLLKTLKRQNEIPALLAQLKARKTDYLSPAQNKVLAQLMSEQ